MGRFDQKNGGQHDPELESRPPPRRNICPTCVQVLEEGGTLAHGRGHFCEFCGEDLEDEPLRPDRIEIGEQRAGRLYEELRAAARDQYQPPGRKLEDLEED